MLFNRWNIMRFAGTVIAGVTSSIAAVGLYATVSTNQKRERWYTDRYHLTPENMRMPFKLLKFHPRDRHDIDLEAWHIPQTRGGLQSKRIVVLQNPYNSDKSNLLGLAQDLWDNGYSVFMFDFRSHSRNKPVQQSIGFLEQQDALAALDIVREHCPDASIAVVGASMGGAVALMTAGQCDKVIAVATDCAFARLDEVVRGKLRIAVPSWWPDCLVDAIMSTVPFFSESLYGYNIKHVSPEDKMPEFTLPLFVIHGAEDELTPVSHAFRIYEKAGTPPEMKERWIIPKANHLGGYFGHRIQFSRRLLKFLDRTFSRHEELQQKKKAAEFEEELESVQHDPTLGPLGDLAQQQVDAILTDDELQ